MADTDMCYIGRKKCGCVVAATVDDPARSESVARDVAEFIKQGYTIERVTSLQVREMLKGCKCAKPQQPTVVGEQTPLRGQP